MVSSSIGGFRPQPDRPDAGSPERAQNPFFGLEDKVSLGGRQGPSGLMPRPRSAWA